MPASPQSSTRKDLFTENDVNSLKQALYSYGVSSGLTATAGSLLSVDIAAGVALFGTTRVSSAGGNVVLTAAHATLARRDIIVMDSSGNLTAVAGTAESIDPTGDTFFQYYHPYPPAIPSNKIILCEVYVAAAATTLSSSVILDKRVLLPQNAIIVLPSTGSVQFVDSTGAVVVEINGTKGIGLKDGLQVYTP